MLCRALLGFCSLINLFRNCKQLGYGHIGINIMLDSMFHPKQRADFISTLLVAKEKFDLEIHPSDTTEIYHCKVHRKLEITPFIEALGATGKENQPDYVRKLRVDLNNKEYPMVTYIEMEP